MTETRETLAAAVSTDTDGGPGEIEAPPSGPVGAPEVDEHAPLAATVRQAATVVGQHQEAVAEAELVHQHPARYGL